MLDFLRSLFSGGKRNWYISENGNQTCVRDGYRLTVFEDTLYGGWKYCIAKDAFDSNPDFSDGRYPTEEQAKQAAIQDLYAS